MDLLMAGLVLCPSATALAQERKVEIHGSVLLATSPEGPAYPRVSPPLAGQTLAATFGIRRKLSPTTSLEAEVVLGGALSNPQRFSYTWREDYVATSRDRLVNVVAHWSPAGSRAWAFVSAAASREQP